MLLSLLIQLPKLGNMNARTYNLERYLATKGSDDVPESETLESKFQTVRDGNQSTGVKSVREPSNQSQSLAKSHKQ